MIEIITWTDATTTFPDDNTTILIFSPTSDEPVWLGYYESKEWYVADGYMLPPGSVTYWANLPNGPDAS
jgi:hypothetical protein